MRITRMELHDIGPFDDAVLEFPESSGKGEVVLFEGPNGCGKTTIAETIAVSLESWMRTATTAPLFSPETLLRPPTDNWKRRTRSERTRTSIDIQQEDEAIRIQLEPSKTSALVQLDKLRELRPPSIDIKDYQSIYSKIGWLPFAFRGHSSSAKVKCDGPRTINNPPQKGALAFGTDNPASDDFGQFLINTEYERMQIKLYAAERNEFADVSSYTRKANSRRETIERIQNAFSHVLDRRVTIEFPIGTNAPRILFNGQEVPIELLGEGMRNTFSWLADLMVRLERIEWADKDRSPFDQDFWLILDEIEESLHPRMQARILPALRHLFPNARIYATTHSPFVVASAGEGTVFRIQPDPQTGRVSGKIEPIRLEPGQSLEWVVSEIFGAPSGFVDEEAQHALDVHERGIRSLRTKQELDWNVFVKSRDFLLGLNDEVRAVVAMREVPVRALIAAKLRERAA